MNSSIWTRISFCFDNARKNNFRHTKNATYVVYIWPPNNTAAYGHLSGNDWDRVWQITNITDQIVDIKPTFTVKTIPNVTRITRTVVWALGINARGTRMASLYFISVSLPAFVNIWKRTSILSQDQTATNVTIKWRKLNVTKYDTRNPLTPLIIMK